MLERKFSSIKHDDPTKEVLSSFKNIDQDTYNKLLLNEDFKKLSKELTDAKNSILSKIDDIKETKSLVNASDLKQSIIDYDNATNQLASKL